LLLTNQGRYAEAEPLSLRALAIREKTLTKPPQVGDPDLDYRKADWLLREYSISILPSVGSLKSLRVYAAKPQALRNPFVGFGNPDLQGMSNEASNQAVQHLATRGVVADVSDVRQLEPLPETKSELQEIAKALHASATSVFVLDQATERRVKTMDLSQTRVIAFATHALTAGEFKGYAEPALVLTPPAQGDEIDDGLLAASEVAQLKLNADWIILSACNTAAADGTPGAPGLSGLARAFIYAGSRALLVSHWDVDSRMAARLTSETVSLHQSDPTMSKAEALRRAMLAVLDDPVLPPQYRHPAFWAPFFIVGD
jgi:CHAT domain-containing protein